MQGLICEYEGERCPDGVDLNEGRPAGRIGITDLFGGHGPKRVEELEPWFCYRTERRAPVRLENRDLVSPVVCAFINARTDPMRQAFFSAHGFLWRDDKMKRADVVDRQGQLKRLLADAAGGDPREAVRALNFALAPPASPTSIGALRTRITPIMALNNSGAPAISLRVDTLASLMLMECATAAELGARFTACEHCGTVFLTGPTTNRRSQARFCKTSCRVLAMHARNAQKEG